MGERLVAEIKDSKSFAPRSRPPGRRMTRANAAGAAVVTASAGSWAAPAADWRAAPAVAWSAVPPPASAAKAGCRFGVSEVETASCPCSRPLPTRRSVVGKNKSKTSKEPWQGTFHVDFGTSATRRSALRARRRSLEFTFLGHGLECFDEQISVAGQGLTPTDEGRSVGQPEQASAKLRVAEPIGEPGPVLLHDRDAIAVPPKLEGVPPSGWPANVHGPLGQLATGHLALVENEGKPHGIVDATAQGFRHGQSFSRARASCHVKIRASTRCPPRVWPPDRAGMGSARVAARISRAVFA